MNESHRVTVTAEFSAEVTFEAPEGMDHGFAERVACSLVRTAIAAIGREQREFATIRQDENDASSAVGLAYLSIAPELGAVAARDSVG